MFIKRKKEKLLKNENNELISISLWHQYGCHEVVDTRCATVHGYGGILTSFPRSSLSSLRSDVEDIDENQAFCDVVNTSLTGWILFLPDHEIKLSFQNPSGAF